MSVGILLFNVWVFDVTLDSVEHLTCNYTINTQRSRTAPAFIVSVNYYSEKSSETSSLILILFFVPLRYPESLCSFKWPFPSAVLVRVFEWIFLVFGPPKSSSRFFDLRTCICTGGSVVVFSSSGFMSRFKTLL